MSTPKGFISKALDGVIKFFTNYSPEEVSSNYALDMRGLRLNSGGYLLQRDYGTQQLYSGQTPPLPNGVTSMYIYDGWVMYDSFTGLDYDIVACICTTRAGGGTRLKFFVYDGTWTELTRVINATINGTPGTLTKTVNISAPTENGASITPGVNEFQDFFVVNTSVLNPTKRSAIIVSANTSSSITNLDSYLGSDGLIWTNGDNLIILQSNGLSDAAYDDTIGSNGTPQIRVITQEDQRKFTAYLGRTTTTPLTRQLPIRFMKRTDQRKYFWTGSAANLRNLNVGGVKNWCSEVGGGLTPLGATFGSPIGVIQPSSGHQTTSSQYPIDTWLQIEFDAVAGATPNAGYNPYCFFAITCVYASATGVGYQESDPVILAYCGTSNVTALGISLQFDINFARMPKDLIAFNIYDFRTSLGNTIIQAIYDRLNTVAWSDFILVETIPVQGSYSSLVTWSGTAPGDVNGLTIHGAVSWSTDVARTGTISLSSALNHNPSMTRALIKPRFISRGGRDKGQLVAADSDDRTLWLTSFDGYQTHEDDNFVSTTPDLTNFNTRITLNGQGELQGLSSHESQVLAFKWSEIEVIDLIAGSQDLYQIDFAAKRSIIKTDWGTLWAGNRGIYMMRYGGGNEILPINKDWQNLYDGTMQNSAGTGPIITAAARKAIIAGWDPTYEEALFQVQASFDGSTTEYMVYRYNPGRNAWSVRKFQLLAGGGSQTPIAYFAKYSNGTIVIGAQNNLLTYPVRTTYLDELTSGGTGGQGFDTWVIVNVGEIYELLKTNVLYSYLLDFLGSSISGTGTIQVDLYANYETTPYDTQTFPIDQLPLMRLTVPRGAFDSIRVKVSIPSGQVSDIKNFNVDTFAFNFIKYPRIGNN